jgi:hypothetical protein
MQKQQQTSLNPCYWQSEYMHKIIEWQYNRPNRKVLLRYFDNVLKSRWDVDLFLPKKEEEAEEETKEMTPRL